MVTVHLKEPGGLDNLVVQNIKAPALPLAADKMTVRIHANSLNYHDYLVVTGKLRVKDGLIPLSDASGEVVAVGESVKEFKIGDHVISTFFTDWPAGQSVMGDMSRTPGDGVDGYAREFVSCPASHFTMAPDGYSHEEAATLPCAALTAWRALFVDAALKPGDSVLVQGTGGVSIFALQFAKSVGATVLATSSSNAKLERLKALGADYTINYREEERWGAAAKAMLGRGFDHIVEVGGAGTLSQSIAACRDGGHIALIGVLTGFAGSIPTSSIMTKQLRVTGLVVGSRPQQMDMVRAIDALGIKPVVDKKFKLSNIVDAFRYQESGQHFGKITLRV